MTDPLLRRKAVEAETGLSRSSIYRMMLEGDFPRPIRIGPRAVAWRTSTIEQWKSGRPPAAE